MSLDLWILAALGLFAAIGFYTGAIQQFSHWIGMAAASGVSSVNNDHQSTAKPSTRLPP